MSESELNELQELSWRRRLSPVEEARLQRYLSTHPEAQPEWENDTGLTHLLDKLPPAPVASNFTAQVLRAVKLEQAARARTQLQNTPWWRAAARRWIPRAAAIAMVTILGLAAYHHYQTQSRMEVARGLNNLANVAALTDPKVFQDFEAIQRLEQAPPVMDEDLWVALNQ